LIYLEQYPGTARPAGLLLAGDNLLPDRPWGAAWLARYSRKLLPEVARAVPRYRFLLLGNNIIHDGVLPLSTFFPGLPGLEMTLRTNVAQMRFPSGVFLLGAKFPWPGGGSLYSFG